MIRFTGQVSINPSPIATDNAAEILRRQGYSPSTEGNELIVNVKGDIDEDLEAARQIRERLTEKNPEFPPDHVQIVRFSSSQKSEESIVMAILRALGLIKSNGKWNKDKFEPGRSDQYYINQAKRQARKENPNLPRTNPDSN